ncbi:hypothetical protein ABEB36_009949 [Hypothenemus hampei]|uniref:Pre-mRNA-splicing regulator female-lethal(2)D n=1 Tax=Hypothenemus hampei TaxID=57062 RepID=A0ABD1EI24_HYPHA
MSGQGDVQQPSSPAERDKAPSRVLISESEITSLTPAEWVNRWRQQDSYITALEGKLSLQEGDIHELRQNNERVKNQLQEAQHRQRVLVRQLTAKEQETQDYMCQLNELKNSQAPTIPSLRSTLLDPAVNCIIMQLRQELQETKTKLENIQNELAAWKFTPDSNTGKRLMAKCRLLYQENEELGKLTSSGRIAKLESDLALQKSFSEEVRQSQNELDSFLADLDEDVEGMQSTILFLQTELKRSKELVQALQKENGILKMSNGRTNGENSNSGVCDTERTDSDNELDRTTTNPSKRVRRSSVLSLDFNEDDALVISTNGDVAMSDNE